MFSGIVQSIAEIVSIEDTKDIRILRIRFPWNALQGLKTGASVSISGVCLTVTNISDDVVSFDVMGETTAKTTIGGLETCLAKGGVAYRLNIERSLKYGDEIGGHLVSGHVHGVAEIVSIEKNCFWFSTNPSLITYIFEKGFIALDGCSLTVVNVDRETNRFSVCFIPETLARTTFGERKIGDWVNVEVDQMTRAVVDGVRDE